MSILVTGGAGFIGSHVLDRLALMGRRAVCLDNFNDYYSAAVKRDNIAGALASGAVELVEGDICAGCSSSIRSGKSSTWQPGRACGRASGSPASTNA